MIRPTTEADTPVLLQITRDTGVFKPMEIDTLDEVLADYHASMQQFDHQAITFEIDGRIDGFAYYAPAPMTDRSWYLYWIVVRKDCQAKGVGGEMLRFVEDDIRKRFQGRALFIETGSQEIYDLTRRFYLKYHYDQEAVLRDFYADGESMVVFRKML